MLGKTPAVTAMAAMFTIFCGAAECSAQSAPSTGKAAQAAEPENSSFEAWRDRFRARALKAGIPHDVFEAALGNIRPDPTVQEKNADQPEFTRAIWDYLDGAVSETRIRNGRKMLRRHASLLAKAEKTYGVPRHFLVAIWGMETSYGALLGKHNIFEALATLSYQGGRTDYGEEQLLAALRLLAEGHKPLNAMKGSWAGAVGHTQFVPTTYLQYAVDGDKDGRRDLWDSLSDVFHSTAHYLKESGFDPNLKWGREAVLPDDFDYAFTGYDVTKPLSQWRALGVKMTNGAPVPDLDIPASVLVPAGHKGPAFLVYKTFKAILAYNRSTSYALAIGLLSDRLRGGPSLQKSWPRHLKPLKRDERIEIQQRLTALGFEPGKADGVLGRETRAAIREFQKTQGDVADGYATHELLAKLRTAKPVTETASAEPAPDAEDAVTEIAEAPQADEAAMKTEAEPATADEDRATEVAAAPQPDQASTVPAAEAEESAPPADAGETAASPAQAAAVPPDTADTPLPRSKPAAAEAGPARLPRAKPVPVAAAEGAAPLPALPGGRVPPRPKPKHAGVSAALAAPGLVILGNGVAATTGPASAEADAAASMPVNNGNEPIVAPPGIVYVGASPAMEEAAADPSSGEGGKPGEKPDAQPGAKGEAPEPEPGS